jgi:DNA ligase-associated metallophosphoesterase
MMRFVLQGEPVLLLPSRGISWPRERMLIVTDLHLGKSDAFRARQTPIPDGSTGTTLARLEAAVRQTQAERLMILGDFWHAPASRSVGVLEEIAAWRRRWPNLRIDLTLGNHDRRAGGVPAEWDFNVYSDALAAPFAFRHYPDPADEGYVLSGHLHPSIRLAGRGRQRERLPCFWFGSRVGVLPSFGDFTGLSDIQPQAGDEVFVVAGDEVIRAGS